MNKRIHALLGAALLAVFPASSFADEATTRGGFRIVSSDNVYAMNLGGRVHLDYGYVDPDQIAADQDVSGFYLRRAYLTLTGHAQSVKYKFEVDFRGPAIAREIWFGTDAFGGEVQIGHIRPAYGMEMLTSSNDLPFIERQFISKDTLMTGREFQNGVVYKMHRDDFGLITSFYSANAAQDETAVATPNGSQAAAFRVFYTPINDEEVTLHVGAAYDYAAYAEAGDGNDVRARAVSRFGPRQTIVSAADYDTHDTMIFELAGRIGPVFGQGEYAIAQYAGPMLEQQVDAWYLEGTYFLTGEVKPYSASGGSFKAPKELVRPGAIELKLRYASIENRDAVDRPRARGMTAGFNYYRSPTVRFLLDYNRGSYLLNGAPDDSPWAVVGRAQFVF